MKMSYQVTICIRPSGLENEVMNYKNAIFALQSGHEAYSAFLMFPLPSGKMPFNTDIAVLRKDPCYACRKSHLMNLAVYDGNANWRFYCKDCAVVLEPLVKRMYGLFISNQIKNH